MFRYAFLVTSLITVFLVCLQVHKAICESDKKYWLRDQQYWPSIQKYRNLLRKSKASGGEDTRRDASHLFHNSRKHKWGQERLDMQVNIRPMFRVKVEDVIKPDVYSFNAKQKYNAHGGHAREGDVADKGLGHSRESYIRSQANQKLIDPTRLKIIEEDSKGLSIYEEENHLQNVKNIPSQLQKEPSKKHDLYEPRAKILLQTKFIGRNSKTTKRNNGLSKKYIEYSAEKMQKKFTMIRNNVRERKQIRTRGRMKGRDFDRYKEERDLDREEQELEEKDKENEKKNEKDEPEERQRTLEERDFDRFKEGRDVGKKKSQNGKKRAVSNKITKTNVLYNQAVNIKRGRVTQGYSGHEEPNSDKKDENTYESIDIISEEKQSDFYKNQPVIFPRHPKQNKRNMSQTLRINEGNKGIFLPDCIAQQLTRIKIGLKYQVDIVQEVLGHTFEGNEIVLWKIKEKRRSYRFARSNTKKKYVDEPPEKKIVFIVHGLSVMGWPELDCLSKTKRFNTLIGYYLENLDSFDIYLIPMANPDGVSKIMLDKWWNKNNSPQMACPGVSLDRNFDVHWNITHGRLLSSCLQSYPGLKPFSERETRAVREVFHRYGHKIVAYFHVHAGSYDSSVFKGDAVLYPRGYMVQQSEDDKYVDMKGDIDEAMRNTSFKTLSVTVDTLHSWYGKVLGSSVDYASTVIGIPYCLELVMQIYKDNKELKNPDDGEKNAALVEVWQVLIDVIFDSIYRNAIKPNERR